MLFYVVQPGDTVYSIASMTGNTVEELLRNNGLTQDSVLVPGQALVLAELGEERTQKREISVNGGVPRRDRDLGEYSAGNEKNNARQDRAFQIGAVNGEKALP